MCDVLKQERAKCSVLLQYISNQFFENLLEHGQYTAYYESSIRDLYEIDLEETPKEAVRSDAGDGDKRNMTFSPPVQTSD